MMPSIYSWTLISSTLYDILKIFYATMKTACMVQMMQLEYDSCIPNVLSMYYINIFLFFKFWSYVHEIVNEPTINYF